MMRRTTIKVNKKTGGKAGKQMQEWVHRPVVPQGILRKGLSILIRRKRTG